MSPNTTELKRILLEKEISQIELADKTGIWNSRLNMIVNGWCRPTEEQAKAISKAIKMPVKELFGEVYPE